MTLTQALYYLLNNAADAELRGIEVSYGWNEQELWISVRDCGEGFPQHILEQDGQPEISGKSSGHGLGLFLSRAVVERLAAGWSCSIRRAAALAHRSCCRGRDNDDVAVGR